jgi:hypothetical protein
MIGRASAPRSSLIGLVARFSMLSRVSWCEGRIWPCDAPASLREALGLRDTDRGRDDCWQGRPVLREPTVPAAGADGVFDASRAIRHVEALRQDLPLLLERLMVPEPDDIGVGGVPPDLHNPRGRIEVVHVAARGNGVHTPRYPGWPSEVSASVGGRFNPVGIGLRRWSAAPVTFSAT